MDQYTKSSLAELSFKDLQQVVKSLDLVAQGNRDQLVEKILSAQANLVPTEVVEQDAAVVPDDSAPEAELESVSEDEPETAEEQETVEVAPEPEVTVEPVAAAPEVEKPVTAPKAEKPAKAEKVSTVGSSQISAKARLWTQQMIAGYISLDSYSKGVEADVLAAIASGKQPCVIQGPGNPKFEIKIFDKAFVRDDRSNDIPARRDGVILNVQRRLADANLLPDA